MLLAVELPDGDTTLLVSNGTQGLGPQGYGEVHRLDRGDDGWSDVLLARRDGDFPYDLGVLDSLRLGHDAPIVYALGEAFDLRDGTVVPYDAPIDDDTAPTPCGDVDGDGRSDRCHAHTVLFANGETATFIDRRITGFGRGVEPALFAGCVHRDVSPGLHPPDSGDCGWLAGQHQTAHDRDVDGDGQDDFAAGNTLRNWHNEVLARLDSDGWGDFADLDGDGHLDLVQARRPDADHELGWIAIYRGPLAGDLTPDAVWENPCHIEPWPGGFPTQLVFADIDIDGDGIEDIVASDSTCDGGRIFVNTDPFGP
jgi:hypothetical protein